MVLRVVRDLAVLFDEAARTQNVVRKWQAEPLCGLRVHRRADQPAAVFTHLPDVGRRDRV
jgi:hypothetical protein